MINKLPKEFKKIIKFSLCVKLMIKIPNNPIIFNILKKKLIRKTPKK